jgi:hypothetical protein
MPPAARKHRGFRHEAPVGASTEWFTPPEIFEALGLTFDLDPAAPPGGVPWVPARRHFSVLEDGLAQPWLGRVWLNPPYDGQVDRWLARLAAHGDGLALAFARTDARWWQQRAPAATAVCFVAGRLAFVPGGGQPGGWTAGAPSALLAYGVPCAPALAASGLGQTLVIPRSGGEASTP